MKCSICEKVQLHGHTKKSYVLDNKCELFLQMRKIMRTVKDPALDLLSKSLSLYV